MPSFSHEKRAFLAVHRAKRHAKCKENNRKSSAAAGEAAVLPSGVPNGFLFVCARGFAIFHAGAKLKECSKHRKQAEKAKGDVL